MRVLLPSHEFVYSLNAEQCSALWGKESIGPATGWTSAHTRRNRVTR